MPLELTVAAGTFLLVLFLLGALAAKTGPAGPTDEREQAWSIIEQAIEAHIDALTAAYLRGDGAEVAGRPQPFERKIESFIGDVLMRERPLAGDHDADLQDAVREVLVLEREQLYERILARIERRLEQAG